MIKLKTNHFLLIGMLCLFMFSCNSIEKEALQSSDEMIKILFKEYGEDDFKNFVYRPEINIEYTRIEVYSGKPLLQNLKEDVYNDEEVFYNTLRKKYGKLLEYKILKIEYNHHWFPMWDYGYPHGVIINVLCEYENMKTKEILNAYYIKEKKKIEIVNYMIIENPIE